ncbi:MAG: pyruvate kinase, partial [Gammaproteobacteria bacterium]|nr:pyruvate kinase [Gammaproteobacteria bacterium]
MDKGLKKTLKPLLHELLELHQSVSQMAMERLAPYADYYPKNGYTRSACNLADYLALREHDLLALQSSLARLGFSSLGRGEGHVIN